MTAHLLTAEDLLTGSRAIHQVVIPPVVLTPGRDVESDAPLACVRLRPLSVGILTLISCAARDDASLALLLMIKEAMLEPTHSLEHIRQMHVGFGLLPGQSDQSHSPGWMPMARHWMAQWRPR